jgi:superfamily II DNA or RNA helicase
VKKEDFDPSQFEAIESVLTREVTLIQGPPGTGKTYVGSKIVQMLLKTKKKLNAFQGPIFVVCYTNHALDQFLEYILGFTDKVLRLGNRSKNPALQK